MPPQRRTPCSSNTRRTAGRTPAPRTRMTPSVTCDGVSDTSHVPKGSRTRAMPGFSKNLQFPPQARTKAGSRRFDVSQVVFLSSEATKRQPRPEYERRTYSRKRNRTSAAITAARPKVIFSPTSWPNVTDACPPEAETGFSHESTTKRRSKLRPQGRARSAGMHPPHADAPALRPPKPLRLCALGLRSFSPGVTPLPTCLKKALNRRPLMPRPPCLRNAFSIRPCHTRRLRLPTPLPSDSPPAGGAKKSPLSEKERGPGLTPKTRGCAPYASGSKSSGKSALVYTFCTSSSSSSASVMRMSFCAVSASTGTSIRGTMAS